MNPASTPVGSVEEINPIGCEHDETIYATTSYGSPLPNVPNLPCGDLLGNREECSKICVPLYYASCKGDWKSAQAILDKHQDRDLVGFGINENYDTALHIAASAKNSKLIVKFVENLVNKMTKEQLQLQNKNHNTALCLAAAAGNVKAVMAMLDKNPTLVDIHGSKGMMPLYMASLLGQGEMVNYIYDNSNKMTGAFWRHENRSWVLQKCVEADLFDVALKIVTDRPELTVDGCVLGVLARKTDAFKAIEPHIVWRILSQISPINYARFFPAKEQSEAMQLLKIIWTNIVKLPNATIDDIIKGPADVVSEGGGRQKPKYSSRVLFVAVEMGNIDFLVELISQYPDLMWRRNDDNQTIFHVAVLHRHEEIYNLVHDMGLMKDMIMPLVDKDGNNMLHLVGKSAKKKRLQIQRELLWFKNVQDLMPPCSRERKNKDGRTPHELFMEENEDLITENKKWMKDTANQCLVVAALIASIGFAAAITVPGGYQNNGIPIFLQNRSFIVFAISDAISLIFSTTSILMFLSIFVSRYAEHHYLEPLPTNMMIGLVTLFYSIVAMLIGFSVSFFILFHNKLIWVPIVITILISIPVMLYGKLEYDMLGNAYHLTNSSRSGKPGYHSRTYSYLKFFYHSIYGSGNLFSLKNRRMYYQNPRF